MILTKPALIEGQIIKKGTEVRIIESKNLTRQQITIVDFIKHQINIDILEFIDVARSKRNFMTMYTDELDSNKMRQIESLGFSSKRFRIEPNGRNAIAIFSI